MNMNRERKKSNYKWTDNTFGLEGVKMLSEGLKSNSTLTALNLFCDDEW